MSSLRVVESRAAQAPSGLAVWLDGVSKSYRSHEVLKRVSLTIAPGEFVAIVGRSGCGKSTLLRLLAGLEHPDGGGVNAGASDRRDVRMMFQEPRLLPWRSVLQNVALGLEPSALCGARAVLEQVGLGSRADDWPATLSGGQRQRVALARALVHQPALVLFDEPLGALDALTRIEMQALIEDVWRRRGFTALLVTHDVAEAVALADRIVLIEHGEVVLDERVDLPRPRARGSQGFAAIEARVLGRVLGSAAPAMAASRFLR